MVKRPSVSLRDTLYLSLAILAPTLFSGPLFAANPAVIKVLVQNFADGCNDSTQSWSASKRQEFVDTLGQQDMTIDDFCSCAAQSVFGSLTQQELDQFMDDSSKYEGQVSDHEPWKARIDDGNQRCMAGKWPGED